MPPELSSFAWKMLLDLLCTQERLHKMGASLSPPCKLCAKETGTLRHELLECTYNDNTGQKLLHSLQTYQPTLTASTLLHLGFADLESDRQLPTTLLVAVTLNCIWRERSSGSKVPERNEYSNTFGYSNNSHRIFSYSEIFGLKHDNEYIRIFIR